MCNISYAARSEVGVTVADDVQPTPPLALTALAPQYFVQSSSWHSVERGHPLRVTSDSGRACTTSKPNQLGTIRYKNVGNDAVG